MGEDRCNWEMGTARTGRYVCGRPAKWLVRGKEIGSRRCVCGLHRKGAERMLGWGSVSERIGLTYVGEAEAIREGRQ